MKVKEISVRKANRETTKSADGSYSMREADITLIVEAEEGKLNELEVIDRVKHLVQITLDDDPEAIRSEEFKNHAK